MIRNASCQTASNISVFVDKDSKGFLNKIICSVTGVCWELCSLCMVKSTMQKEAISSFHITTETER